MGRKKQLGATNGSAAKPPQSGSSAASLLLKGKALLGGRRPQGAEDDEEQQHDSGSGSPASSINEGSGGSVDGGNGAHRRPRHGALGPSRLREEDGVDAEITPESSPGSSECEEGSSPLASPPLAPPTITDAAPTAAAPAVVVPPPPSPTPSLTLSEVPGHSSSSRYEAALWALLGAVRRGEGEGEVVDAALLDKLLSLGRLAFDPTVHAGGATSPPRGAGALGWYARLLEAVAESELGAPPCALHRARIGAVFQCAAFFCRLKASGGGRQSPPSKHKPSPPQDGDAASSALADVPPLCRGELRRRLGTLLASLQCPRALSREDVDAMRRDDLLIALRWLESPLAPLDITLRSVLLPLLEGMCKDVLMAGALGEEVNTRLELEISALDEEQQQHATPTLWRAADSVFRLAAGGIRGRLAKGRGSAAPAAPTEEAEQQQEDVETQRQQEQEEEQEPQPPPSQLAADAAPRVADLLVWLRTEKAALACRHSSGLEELLASLPRTLRASLRAQVYEGPGDFIRVFAHHEAELHALQLPPSSTPCLPMPPSSPPRGHRPGTAGGGLLLFRECHRLAPGVAQALKDIGRERFLLEGEPVATPGEVQVLLAELLARRAGIKGALGAVLPKGLEATVQRCLCAASRTTFGGDVFFIVRDLFGGDGVVVAPLSVKQARGPVLSALDQHEDKDGHGHDHDHGDGDGGGHANGGGNGTGGGGESPVEIRVVGGEGHGRVLKVLITSRTAYGLYADELAGSGSGIGGHGGGLSEQVKRQLGLQEHHDDSGGSPATRRRRRRSLTHPMITLHATLVETIPVLVTATTSQQTELRVLARGCGAGRLLKLRAERPPSPSPSPPPIFAVYPEDAAAAGGGGPPPPRVLSPPPPPRENDEISV